MNMFLHALNSGILQVKY